MFSSRHASCFLVGLVALGLAGCAAVSGFWGDEEANIWSSDPEFVRIVPQGEWRGALPPPNQQPVTISPSRIESALRPLRVRLTTKQDPQPLFSEAALKQLSHYLSEGLEKAGPRQDVTFVIEDWYGGAGLFGIRGNKMVAGRVFYVDNRLNVIFGSLLADGPMSGGHAENTARNIDSRLKPFKPGSRDRISNSRATLSAPANQGIFRAPGGRRNDWLVFDTQALTARRPVSPDAGQNPQSTTEMQALRQEVETLKQQLRTPQSRVPQARAPQLRAPQGAYTPPPRQNTVPPQGNVSPDQIERRMTMLQSLRQRGLISQEEYERKRQAILDGL